MDEHSDFEYPLNVLLEAVSLVEGEESSVKPTVLGHDREASFDICAIAPSYPTDAKTDTTLAQIEPWLPSSNSCPGEIIKGSKTQGNEVDSNCEVCGDRSTGIHYKVMACEGCKGFFRRSIRNQMNYVCYRQNNCIIDVNTRNQCRACRLQKCYYKGMSKECIRPNRVHKNNKSNFSIHLPEEMETLFNEVFRAYENTFLPTDIQADKLPSPKNSDDEDDDPFWDPYSDFSESGAARIISFAISISGFQNMDPKDKDILLKYSLLEIMILRASTRYFPSKHCIILPTLTRIDRNILDRHLGNLLKILEDLCIFLMELALCPEELAILEGLFLFSPDRLGLINPFAVWEIQNSLRNTLILIMEERHLAKPSAFLDLWSMFGSIRSACLRSPFYKS